MIKPDVAERLRCRIFVAERFLEEIPEPWPAGIKEALEALEGEHPDVADLIAQRARSSETV